MDREEILIPESKGSGTPKVPIWEKANLTLPEAAELYNIGINRLREISDDDRCPFVLFVGNKRLIKRKQFDEYLAGAYSI